jgi:hypothetical protein
MMKDSKELSWEFGIPFFKNTYILKSVGKVFGIAMLAMLIFVYVINLIEGTPGIFFAMLPWLLTVFLLVAVIAFVASWIVLGNRYHVRYTINEDGVWMMGTEGRFEGVARATAIVGFLKKNPTVAGAGLLAKNSDGYMIAWEDMEHIDRHPDKYKFHVRQTSLIQMTIFCTKERYPKVSKMIDSYYPTKD